MSTNIILDVLRNMTELHQSLNILAKNKTEIVKKGDVSALQSLLKEESKQVREIRRTEATLLEETQRFLQENEMDTNELALSKVIELVEEEEKEELNKEKQKLENEIYTLKGQNQLNQELLAQSLQFVQISLDLLQPDIESYNYEHLDQSNQEIKRPTRSIFDSKA